MTFDQSYLDDEKQMTEAERKEYVSAIAAIWPRIEKDIKRFLFKQLMINSNQMETWDQVLVGRGAFAGQEMLYDYWNSINQEYIASISFEEFEKFNSISEI